MAGGGFAFISFLFFFLQMGSRYPYVPYFLHLRLCVEKNSSRRTQSPSLRSGTPPPLYDAFPPNERTPFNRPRNIPPPYLPRSTTPRPPPAQPPRTVYIHHSTHVSSRDDAPAVIRPGLVICVVIMLLQTVLIICRSDALALFVDLESAARRESKERFALVEERGRSEREREKLRHERELWEKEKEDRVPPNAFWEAVWPASACHAYGKREYWGTLQNIPKNWTAMDACMNMPVEISGVTIRRPYRCTFVRGSPHIHGRWIVDWDQTDCKPWYRDFHDAVSPMFLSIRTLWLCSHKSGMYKP